MWSKIRYGITLFALTFLIFLVGYLVGRREWLASNPQSLTYIHWTGARLNSLSQVRFVDLNARTNLTSTQKVGELIIAPKEQKTDILVRITMLPPSIALDSGNIAYPSSFRIFAARRTPDGLSFQKTDLGMLIINTTTSTIHTFTTTLDADFTAVSSIYERILLYDELGASQLPPFDSADFPSNERSLPSPYVWSDRM